MIENDLAARTRRSILTVGIFGPMGVTLIVLVWSRAGTLPLTPWLIDLALHIALPALWLVYRRPPLWASFLVGMALAGTTLTAMTITNAALVEAGGSGAYTLFKMLMVTIALIAPPSFRIALLPLIAFAAVPVVQYFSWPALLQGRIGPTEPWGTMAVAVFAIVVLGHRVHAAAIEARGFAARAEAQMLERMAHVFLAARDLANSPLQTLQSATDLLHAGYPDQKLLAKRMYRALSRLRQLSGILSSYESKVKWTKKAESFDAIHVLKDAAARRADPPAVEVPSVST
jgi:hypothetical protein